jgi:WD40 repeat protein
MWDATTGKPIGPARMQADALYCAKFSPDGKLLATGGLDGIAKLWPIDLNLDADPERIELWIETITRLYIKDDRIEFLSPPQWLERKQRLQSLGGPPLVRQE